MRIAMAGTKGGTGKTTLAVLLAWWLAKNGTDVAVQDLDPQGSLASSIGSAPGVRIWAGKEEPEVLIMDCPPRLDSRELRQALRTADRILVPLEAGTLGAMATIPLVALIEELKKPGAKARLVFSRIRRTALDAPEELRDLAKAIGLPAMKTAIRQREGYRRFLLQGPAALDRAAREELNRLALEVLR